ncbi:MULTISPECIES: hypothetical protein [Enterobacteriaceae]|nr:MULTISPECIES: hypothetical protein [Enterobacteriaceae]MDD0367298.1 hypothetical protein [Shigella sonnei]
MLRNRARRLDYKIMC